MVGLAGWQGENFPHFNSVEENRGQKETEIDRKFELLASNTVIATFANYLELGELG